MYFLFSQLFSSSKAAFLLVVRRSPAALGGLGVCLDKGRHPFDARGLSSTHAWHVELITLDYNITGE